MKDNEMATMKEWFTKINEVLNNHAEVLGLMRSGLNTLADSIERINKDMEVMKINMRKMGRELDMEVDVPVQLELVVDNTKED